MTSRQKLFAVVVSAYWDLGRVLQTLWPLVAITYVVLWVEVFAGAIVPRRVTYSPAGIFLIERVIDIIATCFMTPLFIAVHRLVLLGEVRRSYSVDLSSQRFILFWGWWAVMSLIVSIPAFTATVALPVQYYFGGSVPLQTWLIIGAATIASFVTVMRLLILLPAIATDVPGAVWQNAWRDTRGHMLFVVLAGFLPSIPLILLSLAVRAVIATLPKGLPAFIAGAVIGPALLLAAMILGVVVASRLFELYGQRLRQRQR